MRTRTAFREKYRVEFTHQPITNGEVLYREKIVRVPLLDEKLRQNQFDKATTVIKNLYPNAEILKVIYV